MTSPALRSVQIEYKFVPTLSTKPGLFSVQIEYAGGPVPLARPALRAVQIEYAGAPVPLARPTVKSAQIEYYHNPPAFGLFINGEAVTVLSRAKVTSVPLTHRLNPAYVLSFAEVSGNALFDAESKWRYIVVQYLNRDTGELRNIIHGPNGSNWEGFLSFDGGSPLGTWDKRTLVIRSKLGEELTIFPTAFPDGESLVIQD